MGPARSPVPGGSGILALLPSSLQVSRDIRVPILRTESVSLCESAWDLAASREVLPAALRDPNPDEPGS